MYIKLIFSKQLTINKCTLLDYTLTEILMYFIYLAVHAFGSVLCTHTLLVQTHTHMTFPPPLELRFYAIVLCFYVKIQKHTFFTICILTFKEIYLCVVDCNSQIFLFSFKVTKLGKRKNRFPKIFAFFRISFAREKCKNFRFFAKKFGTKKIQKFV